MSPTRTLCSGQRWHRTGQDRWSRRRRSRGCRYRPSSAPRPGWSPGYCRNSRTPWGTEYPARSPFASTSVRRTRAFETGRGALERYRRIEPVDAGGHGECDRFVVVGDPLPVGQMRASGVGQLDDRSLDRLVVVSARVERLTSCGDPLLFVTVSVSCSVVPPPPPR